MSYSMNQFISDWQTFYANFNEANQAAFNNLKNMVSNIENMSTNAVSAAVDAYIQSYLESLTNAVDAVANSPEVSTNAAASTIWQNINDVCPQLAGAVAGNYFCDPSSMREYIKSYSEYMEPGVDRLGRGVNWGANNDYIPISGESKNPLSWIPDILQNIDRLKAFGKWWMDNIAPKPGQFSHLQPVYDAFYGSQNFIYRSDPLTLDLDGDGIETSAASSTNPIMFDYNGDGTKTSTGWIKSDDGMLVLDRNGNGTIDNASELFSDYTPLTTGGNSANGFAALKDQDTNNDGVVNNLDANWNNLKVWQDANSDGISQADELHTLDELGITGINVARTNTTQTLTNGNSIKGTGTFTKADGTTGNMGDVYLNVDTTTQQFTDTVTVSPEAEALPDMSGSGLVRTLHEAASLSPTLQTILTQYSQATTRNEQLAIIDQLLDAWADTSGMAETMESRDSEHYRVQYNGFGNEPNLNLFRRAA